MRMTPQTTDPRTPVAFRALLRRLNRRLALDHKRVCTTRGLRTEAPTGAYYLFDFLCNAVRSPDLTPARLERMARRLGLLHPREYLDPATVP
jgi:hypothetical protein